jgi:hypothetical protein
LKLNRTNNSGVRGLGRSHGKLRRDAEPFDEYFAAVCGLEIVDHIHFGGFVPGIRADVVARHLDRVRETIAKYF